MRFVIILLFATVLGSQSAVAQTTAEQDKGFLVNLIEENLSGGSRTVSITGFEGALSSAATIDILTISDSDGIWLTLEDVALIWKRSALFRGRIEIETLSAAKIILARSPVSDAPMTSPETTPFTLPELPVGIQIDTMAIGTFILGAPFLGEEETFALQGRANLAGGEGEISVSAQRLGDHTGAFDLAGSYSNATQQLAMSVVLDEPANGIAANLLGLPGEPSVKLELNGDAPIKDFTANINLWTDGQERIAGVFTLEERNATKAVSLDISGDVTPLFAPEYQEFFGPDVALSVIAMQTQDDRLILQDLALKASALTLNGDAELSSNGWPTRLSLSGDITGQGGDNVLLPLAGEKRYVDRASLNIGYDVSISDQWTSEIAIVGFDRPGLYIRDLTLTGGGQIVPAQGNEIGIFNAQMAYRADGLQFDDAARAKALGDVVRGEIDARYIQNEAFQFSRFTMSGAGIDVRMDADIDTNESTLNVRFHADADIERINRFSTLVGRELDGAAQVSVTGAVQPLTGGFDVSADGKTENLAIGITQADRILNGIGTLDLQAARDENGLRIDRFNITTPQANVDINANFTSQSSAAMARVNLSDVAAIEPRLAGPFSAVAELSAEGRSPIDAVVRATFDIHSFDATATAVETPQGYTVNFDARTHSPDLSTFSDIADRPLSGQLSITSNGVILSDGQRFDVNVDATTTDITVANAPVDTLLAGQGSIHAQIARLGDNIFRLSDFTVETDAIAVTANGEQLRSGTGKLSLDAVLNDAGIISEDVSGPINATVQATRDVSGANAVQMHIAGVGAQLDADLDLVGEDSAYRVAGHLVADVPNITPFARLAGREFSGGLDTKVTGYALSDATEFNVDFDTRTSQLGTGDAQIDKLVAGQGQIVGQASLSNGKLRIPSLRIQYPNIQADGALAGEDNEGSGQFHMRLRDVGLFTDQLSGAATATGTARLTADGDWDVDANATGPGGMNVDADGLVQANGTLNLGIRGGLPLALANDILAPRRLSGDALFDLAINGPANVGAINGTVTLRDGRLAAPTLGEALTGLRSDITINGGRAQIDASAQVRSGGRFSVNGPVNLTAGQDADLTIRMQEIAIKDAALYETSLSGVLTAKGPLSGGAKVAGDLQLGPTELRVPSSGIGTLGDLPDVTHINASPDVTQTLRHADAIGGVDTPQSGNTNSPLYPLDITINAPSRIFVRGRGLDVELGGTLRIGGNTNDIVPTGVFEMARGRLDILQQRFQLTEGSASLQGDFTPVIRLVARTQAETGTVIRIIVEGPATEPEVRFESTPDLPQDEVLAQLIFGRDIDGISPLQAVQLASAVSTLAGRGGGGLISDFRQGLRLDDLDITTDEDGNPAVRAGAYLSKNVYTDVTVSSDGTTDININLDITDEITAKGSAGADGETSIGIFFERDY